MATPSESRRERALQLFARTIDSEGGVFYWMFALSVLAIVAILLGERCEHPQCTERTFAISQGENAVCDQGATLTLEHRDGVTYGVCHCGAPRDGGAR